MHVTGYFWRALLVKEGAKKVVLNYLHLSYRALQQDANYSGEKITSQKYKELLQSTLVSSQGNKKSFPTRLHAKAFLSAETRILFYRLQLPGLDHREGLQEELAVSKPGHRKK